MCVIEHVHAGLRLSVRTCVYISARVRACKELQQKPPYATQPPQQQPVVETMVPLHVSAAIGVHWPSVPLGLITSPAIFPEQCVSFLVSNVSLCGH